MSNQDQGRPTVYLKEISSTDDMFKGQGLTVYSGEDFSSLRITQFIPQEDDVVLCGGCNVNLYPEKGTLVFDSIEKVALNTPYDIFHKECIGNIINDCEVIRIETRLCERKDRGKELPYGWYAIYCSNECAFQDA